MKRLYDVNQRNRNCLARTLAVIAFTFILAGNVWALDKLCIPNHEGLPWEGGLPPTVDGYVGRTEVAEISGDPRVEQGWVRSALFSYSGGGTNAYTEARIIRDATQPYIYLSFLVRNDPSFDDDDSVVIVLDPGWSSGSTTFTNQARRMIIHPVNSGAGAPGLAGTGSNLIRQNRVPFNTEWSKYTSGWADMISSPAGSDIKVRSWESGASDKGWSVEVKLPINTAAGGSEWSNLGSTFGLYFNVIKLCGASFCTGSTDPAAQDYYTNQYAWPKITSYTSGTPGLITGTAATLKDLVNTTVQSSWLGQAVFSSANSTCKGVRFANGPDGIGVLATDGSLGTTIDGRQPPVVPTLPTNTFVARLTNDGTAADGQGIRAEFRIANWGIGGGPGAWDKIPARPAGNLPMSSSGITPLNGGTANTNPSSRRDVPIGTGQHDLWMQTQVLTGDHYCNSNVQTCLPGDKDAHSCIWVLLDSNNNATISESSVRRNFDITTLSTQRQSAEFSAKGWDAPVISGGPQQFLLFTSQNYFYHPGATDNKQGMIMPKGISPKFLVRPNEREINTQLIPPLELELLKTPGLGKEPLWNYVWMVHANRATPLTMNIGQKTYRVYEPAGSFGRVGQHFGNVDRFVGKLTGGSELKQLAADGPQILTIKNDSTKRLDTVIGADEPGTGTGSCNCGCNDVTCLSQCPKQASNDSGVISGSLALVGTLGVGGFAFLRRRRNQESSGLDERAED